ncbi:MAG: D-alanyl-D-alanine carboxypeptidase/D-alanyl-D-alanine-endopeptidase [Melioribacteraceae bacterium]|nr:D-alanyl-D-alanine carboxypeptidase/D-alanyl-D-alanine-endopeptidase [Melioribacteraceae bacterium]
MKKIYCLFIISLIFVGCSTIPVGYERINSDELNKKIDSIFNDSLFSHAHWGVLIESLSSGKVLYERNSERMFMPASNEKIPTAAAALTKLGPDFRFKTIIGYSGNIIDSTLYGNLIIIGDGDPTLSDRIYDKPTTVFEQWTDSLLSLGIKSISGNIIGDDNKFDDENIGYGWPLDGLGYWYSAEVGPLQLNENYVDLEIVPPVNISDTLKIIPDVISNYYKLINEIEIVDTGSNNLKITRTYGKNDIILKGNVVRNSGSFERSPTITNPTKFYVTVLKEVLENKGITVLGSPIDCDEIPNYVDSIKVTDSLIVHQSLPLHEILKVLMKKSQNLYAETVVRALGLDESGIGSFDEGKKVVESVLEEFGIEPGSHSYMDGSGLSRYNYISPKQIVNILKGMSKSIYWDIWYDTLPIAGVDGTLRWRMKNTKAENNVRAKTGTISNVRGLSGYLKTAEDEDIAFSFLVNGHLKTSRETELITDQVLELISEYPLIKNNID